MSRDHGPRAPAGDSRCATQQAHIEMFRFTLLGLSAVVGARAAALSALELRDDADLQDYVTLDPIATVWPVILEAENFTVAPPGAWNVTTWGRDHYYGATFSNTFVSRKALLHATADSVGTASGTAAIPTAGTWYVAVRYEAPYRFGAEFTLTVKQGAAVKLTKLYGKRTSPKIWAFGWSAKNHDIGGCTLDPTPECHWTWGATENWVWEYYATTLAVGATTFAISVVNSTSVAGDPRGDRNIDAILLTQNLTDIKMRELSEQQLALDGLFTQHDEVFVKVVNKNTTAAMRVTIPFTAYHCERASASVLDQLSLSALRSRSPLPSPLLLALCLYRGSRVRIAAPDLHPVLQGRCDPGRTGVQQRPQHQRRSRAREDERGVGRSRQSHGQLQRRNVDDECKHNGRLDARVRR